MWFLFRNVAGQSCIHRRILFGGLMAGNKKKRKIPSSRVIKVYIKLKKSTTKKIYGIGCRQKKKDNQNPTKLYNVDTNIFQ